MKFGSWTYNGFKIDLRMAGGDGEEGEGGAEKAAKSNGEWTLLGIPGKRNEVIYEASGPEPYLDITYTIKIRRRQTSFF